MNIKRIRCASAAVLSMLMAMNSFMVYADSGGTYEMTVPVSVQDSKGWIPDGTEFTIKLKAVDNAPIPDTTEFLVNKSGDYVFGTFVFDEPGDYEYTISELLYENDKIIFDKTIYHVYTVVLWDDNDNLTGAYALSKEGADVKPEAVEFINDYAAAPADSSSTDDSSSTETTSSSTDTDTTSSSTDTDTTSSTPSTPDSSQSETVTSTTDSSKTDTASSTPDSSAGDKSSQTTSSNSGSKDTSTTTDSGSSSIFPWGNSGNPHTGVALGVGIPSVFLPSLLTMLLTRKRRRDDEDEPPDERSG